MRCTGAAISIGRHEIERVDRNLVAWSGLRDLAHASPLRDPPIGARPVHIVDTSDALVALVTCGLLRRSEPPTVARQRVEVQIDAEPGAGDGEPTVTVGTGHIDEQGI